MNNSKYKVMNNSDLLGLIFSFLRKYPKKACKRCNSVCVWDKKVRNYVELNYYPWNMIGDTLCYECYQDIVVNPTCTIN